MVQRIKDALRVMTCMAVFGLICFIAQEASAQKGTSRRTSVNFEDQLVEGQAQKPELFYLLQQRNNNFKRLIRLRENFLPEMRKASEEVGRPSGKGSAN